MEHRRPTPVLFTSADGRHTVSLVVLDGGSEGEDFNRRLGAVLRAMRLRLHDQATGRRLTQEQAGGLLDRDGDVIGRWERGESLPRIDRLAEVARAYQVPKSEWHLLLDPPELPQPTNPLSGVLEERAISLGVLTPDRAAVLDAATDEVVSRRAQQADAQPAPSSPRAQGTKRRNGSRGAA